MFSAGEGIVLGAKVKLESGDPDAIKANLMSGEIDELYAKIQKLSGYLRDTLRDVKNA